MGGFEAVYEKIKAYSEMTKSECAFIYDLCQERKPKKIVEIGVSSGAGSLLLLEATKESGALLYSVDIGGKYYRDRNENIPLEKRREVGFLCEEADCFHKRWSLKKKLNHCRLCGRFRGGD